MIDLNPPLSEPTFTLALSILSTIFTFLLFLGFVVFFFFVYRLARTLHTYYVHASTLPRYLHGKRGYAYALVAGVGGDVKDLGRAFAEELARRGFNLVLLGGRSVESVGRDMRALYPDCDVRTHVVDLDARDGLDDAIEFTSKTLETLPGPLTVLINNVGGIHPSGNSQATESKTNQFSPLTAQHPREITALLTSHINFTVHLARACLPFLTRPQNQPALILTSAPAVPGGGIPYRSVHSGALAFLKGWSEALAGEMGIEVGTRGGRGVEVKYISTGVLAGLFPVTAREVENDTERSSANERGAMQTARGGRWFAPSATALARGSLERIGCRSAYLSATVGLAVLEGVLGALPAWVVGRVMAGRRRRGSRRRERREGGGFGGWEGEGDGDEDEHSEDEHSDDEHSDDGNQDGEDEDGEGLKED